MTHNPTSIEFNFTTENQSRRLQEIDKNNNKDYLDQRSKPLIEALALLKETKDDSGPGEPHPITSIESKSEADLENVKDLSEEFNLYKEKLNLINSQSQKIYLQETLPRFGLKEKATQTLLTARDLEELEAIKSAPPKDLMLSMLKTSPDILKKIYGNNFSSVFASNALSNFYLNNNYFEKNFANANNTIKEEFTGRAGSSAKKSLSLSKKAEKNLLLKSQENEENINNFISRKRKIPTDYNEFNKNGINLKSNALELKQQKLNKDKDNDKYSKSFNLNEDAKNLLSSLADADNSNNVNNDPINNDFNLIANNESNFTSDNVIFIKRKTDNRRKNKVKNSHIPHFHFSHKLASQEKSERAAKNGSAIRHKKLKTSLNNSSNTDIINLSDENNYNNNHNHNKNNNILNNNLINQTEENDVSLPKDSLNNLKLHNLKSLNLNEPEEAPIVVVRERGRPSKKSLKLDSFLNSKKNSTSNFIEKVKNSQNTANNEYLFSSVNEDYSKSSYDASYAKFGVSSSLNENEDLNDLNNPLIKELNNEIDILNETENKFGRGRGSKKHKHAIEDGIKQQNLNNLSEFNRNDSFVKMSEETNVSNFDNHNEIKKLNFSVTHKPLAKPVTEKISKKFDPYQYFKNEFIQTHQNNSKSEDEIEKECQISWKNMDKDLKAVYFRMADHEKKIFKKIRKLNSLSLRENPDN